MSDQINGVPVEQLDNTFVEPDERHANEGHYYRADNLSEELQRGEIAQPQQIAVQSQSLPLVLGFDFDDETISQSERARMADVIFSYIGVTPRPVDSYTGRWLECLGCVVAPLSAEVDFVDPETGELTSRTMYWEAPLIKLAAIDEMTDMHVILTGGGAYGKKFVRTMTAVYGAGDWKEPRMIFISQESRTGVNRETRKTEPRRMYRFASKPKSSEDKKHAAK